MTVDKTAVQLLRWNFLGNKSMTGARPVCLVLLGAVACSCAAASAEAEMADKFLAALKPVPDFKRQDNAGAVLREMKAQEYIPFKPRRIDYTDYYPLLKNVSVFGHDLVVVEEEYMTKFVGCCVSEGAGFVVRLNGDAQPLERFAAANQCRVDVYENLKKFRESAFRNLDFLLTDGKYAEVSCRVRDETQ